MLLRKSTQFALATLAVIMMVVTLGAIRAAAPPNVVTYQGRVLDSNGVPVSDASVTMKFLLYDASTSGTCVWSNSSADCDSNTPASTTGKSVTLTTGLFTQNLGDTGDSFAAIADSVFGDNTNVYLEVDIAGETLTPRKRLTAAPYALNAQRLDGIDSTGFLASTGDTGTGIFDFSGATLSGASPIVFEGATANDFETIFALTDPTGDNTITFKDGSGTVAFTSDVTSQWELGSGRVFEDDNQVVIGTNQAFAYATEGVGDLLVVGELEVLDSAFFENDVVIGASTSATETLSHTSFTLGGDDLFVAGSLGVEGVIYSDGGFTVATDTTFSSGAITTTGSTDLALTIAGGDLTFAQNTIIGDGGDSITINTSDWDISATGDLSGIGTIVTDGDATLGADLIVSSGARVGTGSTPTSFTALANDSFFVEGAIEIDGAARFDSTIDINGTPSIGADITFDASTPTITITNGETMVVNDGTNALLTIVDAGTTGNVTISGDLTISGDDLTFATNTSGAILVGDGTNYNPAVVSGDITISSSGVAAVQADSIALSTDTTGNYLATLADGGSNFTIVGSGSEGAAVTIDIAADAINFDEMADALVLDASTSIAFDSNDQLLFSNAGTGNIIFDLSSTGDLMIQDNGLNRFTASDDGNFTFDGGVTFNTDATFALAGTENISITNSSSTSDLFILTTTSAGNNAQDINFTLGNDGDVDTIAALNIDVTSAVTGDADRLRGINIEDLTSANATVNEIGLRIGNGWDRNLAFADTSTVIGLINNGVMTFTEMGNDTMLMSLTDNSDTGDLILTGDLELQGDNLDSSGSALILNATAADEVRVGTGTPGVATGAGDLYATSDIEADGNLDVAGSATVGSIVCADCFDFTEFSDAMALDASTTITLDGEENLTITNASTDNVIIDLASTGDFLVTDGGVAAFWSFLDDQSIDYSSIQTTTDALDFSVNSLTTGTGIDLNANALTSGDGVRVTSTSGALTSGSLGDFNHVATYSSDATLSGSTVGVQRNLTTDTGGQTLTVTGAVATFTNTGSQSAGTLTDNSNVLSLIQNYTGTTGAALSIMNEGSGQAIFIDNNGSSSALTIDSESTGADAFSVDVANTNGTLFDVGWDGSTTQTAGIFGFSLDMNTNLVAEDNAGQTGFTVNLDGLTANTASSSTNFTGYHVQGGAFDTANDASPETINWYGFDIALPNLDTGDSNDVVSSYGIRITGGGITNGLGTEEEVGIDLGATKIDFDADNDTSIVSANDDQFIFEVGGVNEFLMDATSFSPASADTNTLGSSTNEWNSLFFGDSATALSFGTSASASIGIDTGSDALEIMLDGVAVDFVSIGDAANEDHMTASNGDLLINGEMEVNGNAYFDSDLQVLPGVGSGVDVVIGSTNSNIIDLGADVFSSGGVINFAFDTAEVLTGSIVGLNLDFNANLTGVSGGNLVGSRFLTPTLTASGTSTSSYYGFQLATAGALDTTDASTTAIDWYGVNIAMPDIDTGDAADTVSAYGMHISGGAVTDGAGLEVSVGYSVAGTDVHFRSADATTVFQVSDGGKLILADTASNIFASFADLSSANNHILQIDGNTALSFDSSSDSDVDITTASNEDLRVLANGTGDLILNTDVDTNVRVMAAQSPGVDMFLISNDGLPTLTTNSNALSIQHDASNTTTAALNIDATYTGGVTDLLKYSMISLRDVTPNNLAGTDTFDGLEIGNMSDPGITISSQAIEIGTGWDLEIVLSSDEAISQPSDGIIEFQGRNGSTDQSIQFDLDDPNTPIIKSGSGGTIKLDGILEVDLIETAATAAVCSNATNAGGGGQDVLLYDCSGAPVADYAEQYPAADNVTFGHIVVPGQKVVKTSDESHGDQEIRQVVLSTEAYQGPVIGIVSNNYGDFTSAGYNIAEDENPLPVALVGRVPVKVTDENGPVMTGDYLTTSSTPGYAMKATKVGRVVGMALSDWDGVSDTVMVQVNNSWQMGEIIGTDGISTLVTDNVVVSQLSEATAQEQTFDSYGLSLRGSAWNGSESEAVEMMLRNVVDSSDEYRLSVRNTSETEVAYITDEGTMRIAGDMVIGGKLYPSDRGQAQTEKYIYYDGSDGAGGDFMRTNAKGWSTGSYDFAEMFPSAEELSAGDIVAFTGTGEYISRATGIDGEQVAGIISTRPGFLAGENTQGAYPLALAGRVPARVNTEGGAIAVGDPLAISSIQGVAMKATEPGMIVGYALEAYDGGKDNLLLTYVNLGYWAGDSTTTTPGTDNRASGFASGNTQNFTSLNMSGDIFMGSYSITGIRRLVGFTELWSIEADGTIKTEGLLKSIARSYADEPVETVAVTSPEVMITLTGTGTLIEGQAEIRFESVSPEYNDIISADAPIRVVVTPSGPVSLYVSEKDQNHFVVKRFAGEADVEFDWMVTAYRRGYEPEPVETVVIEEEVEAAEEEVEEVITEEIIVKEIVEDVSVGDSDPSLEEAPEQTEPATEQIVEEIVEDVVEQDVVTEEEVIDEPVEAQTQDTSTAQTDEPAGEATQPSDSTTETDGGEPAEGQSTS